MLIDSNGVTIQYVAIHAMDPVHSMSLVALNCVCRVQFWMAKKAAAHFMRPVLAQSSCFVRSLFRILQHILPNMQELNMDRE